MDERRVAASVNARRSLLFARRESPSEKRSAIPRSERVRPVAQLLCSGRLERVELLRRIGQRNGVEDLFRAAGLDEAASWWVADQVRVLLALPRPSAIRGRGRAADLRLLEAWLARDPVRAAMGVNTWEGVEWLDRDRFEALLRWAVRLDAIATGRPADERVVGRLAAAAEAAGYRIDALLSSLAPAPRGITRLG